MLNSCLSCRSLARLAYHARQKQRLKSGKKGHTIGAGLENHRGCFNPHDPPD